MTTATNREPNENEHYCPDCLNGEVWLTCGGCAGEGEEDGVTCAKCGGAGEVESPDPCAFCGGASVVTRALYSLRDADQWVRRASPEWDEEKNTATIYSKALYYRRRDLLRGKVAGVAARLDDFYHFGSVVLLDACGEDLLAFQGFAWGYGGEGPSGLADVLSDLFPDRFPSPKEALSFVASQSQKAGWIFSGH